MLQYLGCYIIIKTATVECNLAQYSSIIIIIINKHTINSAHSVQLQNMKSIIVFIQH